MRINTRFAVAIHVLVLIELNKYKDISNTSEHLALSVNTNPVVIRRIIAMLKKANLITVKAGVGGASLKRPPQNISWLDIYHAVQSDDEFMLFNKHEHPNQNCYVGASIHEVIDEPLHIAQKTMEEKLSTFTLLDAITPIAKKNKIAL
ncbi:Rrf2 family transcriptional regulator [Zophobihabitans entericus]|uniref:Rrf2 family transcriptional regulator n=1 Tax=Zophobihabitans entericus TaxID=1635327 RepID=A0A6G9IC65_9GAMM|nr:Rrf2 family transcriptional regulator [Zophobihabitans entericus]QIQ21422.1 Rrf2 family transcriptional regulator [Zophobihabitans entericus]